MSRKYHPQRGTILIAAAVAMAVVAVGLGLLFLLPPRAVSGRGIDSASGPLPFGAVVKVAGREVLVGNDGSLTISGVRFGSTLGEEAKGHQRASSMVALGDQLRLALATRALQDVVMDSSASFTAGFVGRDSIQAMMRPDTITGSVRDGEGRPIAGASVSDGDSFAITNDQGEFQIMGVVENATLVVNANGFERQQLDMGQKSSVDVAMKPFSAKSLYLTYYGVGDDGLTNHVVDTAARTEINSVVIDVKGDRGWIVYESSVPMVQEIGAQQGIMMKDPKRFLAELKQRGIYTIARIVTFKDNPLVTSRPDLAVTNANTGKPWVDNEGLRWADPTREEVWDYNIALATEAIDQGFDEVQFDYVRFPTDASAGNSLSSITFSKPNTAENRVAAINGFLEKAKQAIKAKGGSISADVFGYVVWRDDEMGIGQHLEDIAQHVDYVSPMVYPNLFWDGIPVEGGAKYGNQQSGLYPYEIVQESMKIAAKRIGAAKLRPWLEYYNDYLTGKSYTAGDIQLQKQAANENGVNGWLFWDPSNRFDKGGFEPTQ